MKISPVHIFYKAKLSTHITSPRYLTYVHIFKRIKEPKDTYVPHTNPHAYILIYITKLLLKNNTRPPLKQYLIFHPHLYYGKIHCPLLFPLPCLSAPRVVQDNKIINYLRANKIIQHSQQYNTSVISYSFLLKTLRCVKSAVSQRLYGGRWI
jgi:hypothetical protein